MRSSVVDVRPMTTRSFPDARIPVDVPRALARGAVLVDIRSNAERVRDGALPGALVIDPAVLAVRLDPGSPDRLSLAGAYDIEWIVVCADGVRAATATAALRAQGLQRSSALQGGFDALRAAGMLTVGTGVPHFSREMAALATVVATAESGGRAAIH